VWGSWKLAFVVIKWHVSRHRHNPDVFIKKKPALSRECTFIKIFIIHVLVVSSYTLALSVLRDVRPFFIPTPLFVRWFLVLFFYLKKTNSGLVAWCHLVDINSLFFIKLVYTIDTYVHRERSTRVCVLTVCTNTQNGNPAMWASEKGRRSYRPNPCIYIHIFVWVLFSSMCHGDLSIHLWRQTSLKWKLAILTHCILCMY
jgi:hypothetical protein